MSNRTRNWIQKTSELFDSLNLLALSDSARSKIVELEGIEPSSKRGTNVLSTCLFLT